MAPVERRRWLGFLVTGFLVAACSGQAPSPSSSASLTPHPSPSSSSAAGPISPTPSIPVDPYASPDVSPEPETDGDGLPAPDTDPEIDPGELFTAATDDIGAWIVRCTSDETRCEAGHSDPSAEGAWPAVLEGPCRSLVAGEAIRGFVVACDPPGGAVVHAIDQDGSIIPGWPVELGAELASVSWNDRSISCGTSSPAILLLPDGAVAAATDAGARAEIVVLERDATRRDGWPQPFPGDAPGPDGSGGDGCRGFAVAPAAGSIIAWGYEGVAHDIELIADRTEFTSYAFDGTRRDGWPIGSTGAASGPVLRSDGGIAYTSATGKVWAHHRDGHVLSDWPYQVAGLDRDDDVSAPVGAPNGQLAVIVTTWSDDGPVESVHVIRPDGREAGTPLELASPVATGCLFGDTPCAGIIRPVFHPRNLDLFIALSGGREDESSGGEVLALDAKGRIRDGWPTFLGERTFATELGVSLDGPWILEGVTCPTDGCASGGEIHPVSMSFERDGTIATRTPPD